MDTLSKIFSGAVKEELQSIKQNGGVLVAKNTRRLCKTLDLGVEELMLELLPIAANYSIAPISKFEVGAIVRGETDQEMGYPSLYMGANLEFEGLPLNYSLHAEQAAVSNAWLVGEKALKGIAVTAAPCGHCRQFLYEFVNGSGLPIVIATNCSDMHGDANEFNFGNRKHKLLDLNELLPNAFGPNNLDICDSPLTAKQVLNVTQLPNIVCSSFEKAMAAAELSYAPYTENYSGCLIQLNNGQEFVGRYVENAAFNPSLQPFVAALSQMVLSNKKRPFSEIKRVILVEQKSNSSNKRSLELILDNICPSAKLEYYC